MYSDNEPKSGGFENRPVLTRRVIILAIILVTICVLSAMFIKEKPVALIPTVSLPTEMPANQLSTSLPIILSESESVSVSEQIWKVTKIKNLGYELDGQHYDLATFTRIDGQDTVKAYCMNPGWDIPEIGTEYLLNAEGIFVPLDEPDAHPLQRFSKIQS